MGASKSRPPTTGSRPAGSARRVDVQWNGATVRVLHPTTGQLLREHLRAPRGWHQINDADRPARTPAKTLALLAAGTRAGPSVGTICDHIHQHDGAAGVRRILGVLSLVKQHGPTVVEEAATAALALGVPTYRFLKRYLDRRPAVPPGRPGRPVRKPHLIQGDRGYDSQPHRDQLALRGIATQLARRRTLHSTGLGRTRWVVERSLAWLHRFRRLAVRYERLDFVHEAFLTLRCVLICRNFLRDAI